MKIAIIGKGRAGTAIANGLGAKHEIKFGHRDSKEPVAEAAKWGEVIILAIPYAATKSAVNEVGSAADGKIVIDVTNPMTENRELAIGFTTSAAEEIQRMLPKAHVVKAFNTVFAANQSTGRINDEKLAFFVAGDDAQAKKAVMQLGTDIGFDPVDTGPLKSARNLEAMGNLIIGLGLVLGMGPKIGYKLVKA